MSRSLILGTLALLTAGSFAASAVAQTAYRDAPTNYDEDPIVVAAPHVWQSDRDPATGAPIETSVARSRVSYDDLDLRTDEGRDVLLARVSSAARRVCRRLDIVSPPDGMDQPSRQDCEADTVQRAQPQVEDAVYAAGG